MLLFAVGTRDLRKEGDYSPEVVSGHSRAGLAEGCFWISILAFTVLSADFYSENISGHSNNIDPFGTGNFFS